MKSTSLYEDIAIRTGGDIYIGVVGPVRTGKSTFIKNFMERLIIPNIESEIQRSRAIDEMPQSAAGKTIMTTEPKFIPEDAVRVKIDGKASMNVRMIDCVGYILPSAIGYFENEAPRMVLTPWFEEEIPFNMAAEIGTQKVINEHSTIGIVITTDGSFTDIPREEYEESEERVIKELKTIKKPFIVVLNCRNPKSDESLELARRLSEKYMVPVVPQNCADMETEDINEILSAVLYTFPIKEVSFMMPNWINSLERSHWLRSEMYGKIGESILETNVISDINQIVDRLKNCDNISSAVVSEIDLGEGTVNIEIDIEKSLFYKVLEEVTGLNIENEGELMPYLIEVAAMKKDFEKFRSALSEVEATGYGIVMPDMDELMLEEPEIVRQGGKYGVKLRASAPSIHLMKANITAEVSPIVGSEKQSEELVTYMLSEFNEDPVKIWESNIFGKSLHELVNEGLHNKLQRMPPSARIRLQETVEKIINEGCSGLICIIL